MILVPLPLLFKSHHKLCVFQKSTGMAIIEIDSPLQIILTFMKIKKSYKIALYCLTIVKIAVFITVVLGSCNRYVNNANSNKVIYRIK